MATQTTRIRLLILQNGLMPYRIPLYEALAEHYDLTVGYAQGEALTGKVSFQQVLLPTYQWVGMVWQARLALLCNEYQVVICMFDLHWIGYLALTFRPRKYRLILWGIGVSTQNGFDRQHLFDPLRRLLIDRADGLLLYSEKVREQYVLKGVPAYKVYAAPNTVFTELPSGYWENHYASVKFKLLFIGNLEFRKDIPVLISSFCELAKEFPRLELHIVGDGPAKIKLEEQANSGGLGSRIFFHGAIHQDQHLAPHFMSAIACISPGQAGLSVLKSFSFGVPFITSSSAITGGERFDIIHAANGFLYFDNLTQILRPFINNPKEIQRMSSIAFHYYWTHRTLNRMTAGFHRAITQALTINSI